MRRPVRQPHRHLTPAAHQSTGSLTLTLPLGSANWQDVRVWSRAEPNYVGAATPDQVLLVTMPGHPTPGVKLESASGRVLLTHRSKPGWQTQDAWLTDKSVYVLDLNLTQRRVMLVRYALNGERSVVPGTERSARLSPEAAAGGDRLAYFTGHPSTGMCVRTYAGGEAAATTAYCSPGGVILGDPSVVGDWVTFSELARPNTSSRCKTLRIAAVTGVASSAEPPPRTDVVAVANRHARCRAWSAVPVSDGLVWQETRPGTVGLTTADVFFVNARGQISKLGSATTGSLIGCGHGAAWLAPTKLGNSVRYWASPQPQAAVILAPGRDRIATKLRCSQGRYLSTRIDELSGSSEKLTLLFTDLSAPN